MPRSADEPRRRCDGDGMPDEQAPRQSDRRMCFSPRSALPNDDVVAGDDVFASDKPRRIILDPLHQKPGLNTNALQICGGGARSH